MAEAREYTVKHWKAWENEDGLIRDTHGNYKGSVTFEEDNSEPIDATFKNQPEPGDKKYGVVDLYLTKAGKSRKGFKSAPRPQEGGNHVSNQSNPSGAKSNYVPRDDNAIRAQWAIGQAMNHYATKDKVKLPDVEVLAGALYEMVDRVKDSAPSLKVLEPVSVEEAVAQAQARRDQQIIQAEKTGVPVPDEVVTDFGDEPINLDEIPF